MRWGFRSKLLLVTVGLIAVALISSDVFLGRHLASDLTARIEQDLQVRLALVEGSLAARRPPADDLKSWDALADELGRTAQTRVTFIAADGRVLGDSEVDLAALPVIENHAQRGEVAAALARGQGVDRRWSATVERLMMYTARRSEAPGQPPVVVRVALPLVEVDDALFRLRWVLVGGSLLALGIAILLSTVTAQIFGRSLQGITEAARRIAQGDLDVRIRPDTRDEIGQLAGTLDQLADGLTTTLRALRQERDRLGGILAAMEEGVLVVDRSCSIVMANPAARVLLLSVALSPSDPSARKAHAGAPLEGRSLLEAVRSADLDAIVGETLSKGQPASGEVAVDRPRARRLLVHAAPLAGEGQGAVVVLVDVTEIRRLELIRKDFVANVSHELRTPLTAVRTALETARAVLQQERGNPKDADRFLAIADRHTERLTTLVRDLLDLSRVESGYQVLALEPVAPGEVADEVLAVFRDSAARRQLRLEAVFPADLPPAMTDREALVQVLTNLVENAVKYCDGGGVVTVRGRQDAGQMCIEVEDSGPGIAAKHLPRLFERFYRVDPGRSREHGGTGLGLSIVKHLVEALKGTVSVESQPGRGSRFIVHLPLA